MKTSLYTIKIDLKRLNEFAEEGEYEKYIEKKKQFEKIFKKV
jgi:hypothetical protein